MNPGGGASPATVLPSLPLPPRPATEGSAVLASSLPPPGGRAPPEVQVRAQPPPKKIKVEKKTSNGTIPYDHQLRGLIGVRLGQHVINSEMASGNNEVVVEKIKGQRELCYRSESGLRGSPNTKTTFRLYQHAGKCARKCDPGVRA